MSQLSIRKILQALYFIQSKAPKKNESKYTPKYLLKMLYFADRYHLRRFGILASDDSYVAMRKGPVASATFDIIKGKLPRSANSAELYCLDDIIFQDEDSVVIKEQDTDELSKSTIDALGFSVKTFGHLDEKALSRISHDYPEWKSHEGSLRKNPYTRFEMNLKEFFSDPSLRTNLKKEGFKKDPFEDDKAFLNKMREEIDGISC